LKCDHLDCGNLEKVWLPYILREQHIGLKSHPYCIDCGMVKNIGSDRAKSRGYFFNVISMIDKKLKLPGSSVRMRLIAKDLEKIEDFDDAYSMSRYGQEKIIIGLVKKYYQIPERTIKEFL
jgi:hypothetical protein